MYRNREQLGGVGMARRQVLRGGYGMTANVYGASVTRVLENLLIVKMVAQLCEHIETQWNK